AVTRQPHFYDDTTATITSRQATLFDPNDVAAGDSLLTCCTCGRPMVRTASDYLCCPAGHGKLIDERATEPDDEEQDVNRGADRWAIEAALIAERHAARTAWLAWEPCECGACRLIRCFR